MKTVYLLSILLFISSCSSKLNQKTLEDMEVALITMKDSLASVEKELGEVKEKLSGQLAHIVLFKLKSDADTSVLVAEIKKLEGIKVVKNLTVGIFENLNDERALDEYTVAMEMFFNNKDDYHTYQADPIHLALKERAKPLLAAPPATYDYLKR